MSDPHGDPSEAYDESLSGLAEKKPEQEYYIVSLKYPSHPMTFWGPNNNGYTWWLEHAGRYTHSQVMGELSYYNDGVNTMAVPCEVIDEQKRTVVPDHAIHEFRRRRLQAEPATPTEPNP